MSVIMTLRIEGDPRKLEDRVAREPEAIRSIAERAKGYGVIAHRFYGSVDGGEIMVVDEWPDAESFQRFFADLQPEIESIMQEVASGEPQITFWRKLETNDDIGWQA
jgi:hypothetical protein